MVRLVQNVWLMYDLNFRKKFSYQSLTAVKNVLYIRFATFKDEILPPVGNPSFTPAYIITPIWIFTYAECSCENFMDGQAVFSSLLIHTYKVVFQRPTSFWKVLSG